MKKAREGLLDLKPSEFKVSGFRAAGVACGIKKNGRKDLAVIVSDAPCHVAGVFTTNSVKAAPVLIDVKLVKKGVSRGVVVNSGNANACTGRGGLEAANAMIEAAEAALGLKAGSLLVASTGVIGVPMPVGKAVAGAGMLAPALSATGFHDAAEAIMTTDAFSKTAIAKAKVKGKTVTVAGIAKGAGMICPNMATMLAFFVTDANIKGRALRSALKSSMDASFNSIVVDNDTSTNDTALIFANGASQCAEIEPGSAEWRVFSGLLTRVALNLAHKIVKDGEGATRFIEIGVRGAASAAQAKHGAKTVASSFLVKTAFFGGDPNWGRIVAALGYSGIRMDEGRIDISFNNVPVVRNGMDTGAEARAAKAIKAPEVEVTIDLGVGKHAATVWTSDLSYEYVKINSAYRT